VKGLCEQMQSLLGEEKKAYKSLHSNNETEHGAQTPQDVEKLSDEYLKAKLIETWRYKGETLIVWGKLERVNFGELDFVKLSQVRSIYDNALLEYPIETNNSLARKGAYIERDYANTIYEKLAYRFIKCELEFSSASEKEKHQNPFLLKVKNGTAERLNELPLIPDGDLVQNDDTAFISQVIVENELAAQKAKIEEVTAKLQSDLDNDIELKQNEKSRLAEELTLSSNNLSSVKSEHIDIKEKLSKLSHKLEQQNDYKQAISNEIKLLQSNHQGIEQAMANKIKKLTDYIKNKASLLKDLEFIDEDDFDELVLNKNTSTIPEEMLSFETDLASNYADAVSYIQAYMLHQDILYPRHIIENFLTLIRTNDLVVLAGDSGSGKTNLVQSFAKAIGGVSKIIPVKPNWTSSEDLLGYYNPLEKKYLATPFLEALIEAKNNPDVPYLICLDEMNLARVEYYFADFLSKMEERNQQPVIELYSDNESAHVLSELTHVIDIINGAKEKYQKNGVTNFVKLMQDEDINNEMKRVLGFSEKDSLVKYHGDIRRMLSGLITTPSQLDLPANVRIIGAINIDETTHYLSPKILDRAHIMKFKSPLLSDWDAIIEEVEAYDLPDVSKKLLFSVDALGHREPYPKFDKDNAFCQLFIELNREYLSPMGVEFGMRTIRQGLNYITLFEQMNQDDTAAINNFILHKVLPKFTFDGNKDVVNGSTKIDLLRAMLARVDEVIEPEDNEFSALNAFEEIITKAEANDRIVNYWS
jgi:energy-coupling factor transporter ATP-binding protein EcfA2